MQIWDLDEILQQRQAVAQDNDDKDMDVEMVQHKNSNSGTYCFISFKCIFLHELLF